MELAAPAGGGLSVLTGSLRFDGSTFNLAGERLAAFAKTTPAPQAGAYVWITQPLTAPLSVRGPGVGKIVVSPLGSVRLTGKLGDGTPVSAAGQLTQSGSVLLAAPLYGNTGAISGSLRFEDLPGQSDAGGVLEWMRPAKGTAGPYAAGFNVQVPLIGNRLTPPMIGTTIFGDAPTRFDLEGGGLPPGVFALTKSMKGSVFVVEGLSLKASVNPVTRALSGSFVLPGTKAKVPFSGVLLEKTMMGLAQFKTPQGIGTLWLWRQAFPGAAALPPPQD